MSRIQGDPWYEIEQLRRLKARYFRLLDTKDWHGFRELFSDDMRFWLDDTPTPSSSEPVTTTGDAFVEYVSSWLAAAVTIHHGHTDELTLVGPSAAEGIWAMFDWVDDPVHGKAWKGYGHYHEQYIKGADGRWRIKALRLTRLRVDKLPVTSPK